MSGKETHLAMANDRLPQHVFDYLKTQTSEDIESIFRLQHSASMFVRPGVILRLHLENFLTHRDKIIDFQRPITLLHGENGSGKSSVLEAIHYLICGNPRRIRDNISSVGELKTELFVRGEDTTIPATLMRVTGWFWNGSGIVAIMRQHDESTTYKVNYYSPKDKFRTIKPLEAEVMFRELGHFPNNSATMISQTAMKSLARMSSARRYEVFEEASLLDEIESNSYETLINFDELSNQTEQGRHILNELAGEIKEVEKRLNDNQIFVEMVGHAAELELEIMGFEAVETLADCMECNGACDAFLEDRVLPVEKEECDIQQRIDDCSSGIAVEKQKLAKLEKKKLSELQVIEQVSSDVSKQHMLTARTQMDFDSVDRELQLLRETMSTTTEQLGKAERKHEVMEIVPFILQEPEIPEKTVEYDRKMGQIDLEIREITQKLVETQARRRQSQAALDTFEMDYEAYNRKMEEKASELRELKNQLSYAASKNNLKQEIMKSMSHADKEKVELIIGKFSNAFSLASGVFLTNNAERYGSVVRRFISPQDLAQFVIFGEGEAELVHMLDTNYKVITVKKTFEGKEEQRMISGVECVPLLDILEFENDYVKTALLMTKRVDSVVIIDAIKDAERVLDVESQLLVLPLDADCVVESNNGAATSKPIKEKLFRDQAGNSVLYIQAKDNIKAIENKIEEIELEIERIKEQGLAFAMFETNLEEMEGQIKVLLEEEQEITQEEQNESTRYDNVKQQKFKIQQEYQRDLDIYNRKKREHEDYILEKESLAESIVRMREKLEELSQDIPRAEARQKTLHEDMQQEINKLAALRRINEEKSMELNETKVEIETQREFLEQHFDEELLKTKLAACEARLTELKREHSELEQKAKEEQKQFDISANSTFDAAKRLLQETERFKLLIAKASDAYEFIQQVTDNIEQNPLPKMRLQISERCKKLYDALSVLETKIAEREADFEFDFEMENSKLQKAMNEFEVVREQLKQADEQLKHMLNAVACQEIKLSTLRKRAEKETVAAFSRQCELLQIELSLEFKFNTITRLWERSAEWAAMIDATIKQEYMNVFDNNTEENSGSIVISAQRRDISSLSGGEETFVALSFIMALCRVIETSYLEIDEWDVFMDAKRRDAGFSNMVKVIGNTLIETVLVTPNDVDMSKLDAELQSIVGVIRMQGVERGT